MLIEILIEILIEVLIEVLREHACYGRGASFFSKDPHLRGSTPPK